MRIDLLFLQKDFPNGELVKLSKGTMICHVHKKVEHIHWLIKGAVNFVVALNEGDPEVEVCQISEPYLPIGWNGLNPPGRHTKNILVVSEEALFFKVKLADDQAFLSTITNTELHIHVCRKQFSLLKQAIVKQREVLPKKESIYLPSHENYYESSRQPRRAISDLFKRSPFLEPFEDADLAILTKYAIRRDYSINDIILSQDTFSDGLYILREGNIRIQRFDEEHALSQWPISDQGFVFGWPAIIGEQEFCTAQAAQPSTVYFISTEHLKAIFEKDKDFALRFYLRLNWLVDNHINAAFIRFLSFYFNVNQLTIRYLIENYQTQIKASSKLHQIPHLLNSRTTNYLAFDILHELKENGSARERRIASICLDLLRIEKQEMDFLHQLQHIYETVTEQNNLKADETRKACALAVQKLCSYFKYKLEGWQNLPDTAGHIFIYNHLLNHPYYTLNNNFQITLESHFISGMLLDFKYGEPGIRTVRIGSTEEFAHQNYYEKLGYINVFTKESRYSTKEERTAARSGFFETAKMYLREGYNVIISPEGTSYRTEDDIPGEFKSGAFSLALQADNEPFIVPIVLLHFDKRIHEATKYCKILKPFKISEHPLFTGVERLQDFVSNYRLAFKQELEKAKAEIGLVL